VSEKSLFVFKITFLVFNYFFYSFVALHPISTKRFEMQNQIFFKKNRQKFPSRKMLQKDENWQIQILVAC
jgi:hypothetical protein